MAKKEKTRQVYSVETETGTYIIDLDILPRKENPVAYTIYREGHGAVDCGCGDTKSKILLNPLGYLKDFIAGYEEEILRDEVEK